MASDDFGSFLTYLPTLIRYHQMEADLPTYPNIWCQIFTVFNPGFRLNRHTLEWNLWKFEIQIGQKFILFANLMKIRWSWLIWIQVIREHPHMTSDDFWLFLTYLPTQIRYHQMEHDLPTYPNIWRHILIMISGRWFVVTY